MLRLGSRWPGGGAKRTWCVVGRGNGKDTSDKHLILSSAGPSLGQKPACSLSLSPPTSQALEPQFPQLRRLGRGSGRSRVLALPRGAGSSGPGRTPQSSARLHSPGSARTAAPAAPSLPPPPRPLRPPSPRTALRPPAAARALAWTRLPARRARADTRPVPAARAAECREPPARVPSSAGGPRAAPTVLPRPPGHWRGPAQPGRGLRGGRLLGEGEAVGGAGNARARAPSPRRRGAERGAGCPSGGGSAGTWRGGLGLQLPVPEPSGRDRTRRGRRAGTGAGGAVRIRLWRPRLSLGSGSLSCFSGGTSSSETPLLRLE